MDNLNIAIFTDDRMHFSDCLKDFCSDGNTASFFSSDQISNFNNRDDIDAVIVDFKALKAADIIGQSFAEKDKNTCPVFLAFEGDNPSPEIIRKICADSVIKLPVPSNALKSLILISREKIKLETKLKTVQNLYAEETSYREILTDIIGAVNSSLELDEVLDTVMSKTKLLINAEGWSIMLLNEDKSELVFEKVEGQKGSELISFRIKVGEGIAGWVAKTGKPVIVNNVAEDKRFFSDIDHVTKMTTKSILCAPLISREKIVGVVEIVNKSGGEGFSLRDQNTLMTLTGPASIAIENAQLFRKSNYLSITDDLTKLYNSRYFNDILTKEVERSRRYRNSVSLIFLDLDNFKNINDTHGHLAGSRTIYEAGAIIRNSVRDFDIASRYGGDEFTVVLPNTSSDGALAVAERIRSDIESQIFLRCMGLEISITASLGVASFPEMAGSKESLIQLADSAMYYVKENGKNGVHVTRK